MFFSCNWGKSIFIFVFQAQGEEKWANEDYSYWCVMNNLDTPSSKATSQNQMQTGITVSKFPSARDQSVHRSASNYSKADVDADTLVSSSWNKRQQSEAGSVYTTMHSQSGSVAVMSSHVAKSYCTNASSNEYCKASSSSSFTPNTSLYGMKDIDNPQTVYGKDWSEYENNLVPSKPYSTGQSSTSQSHQATTSQASGQREYNNSCTSTYSKQKKNIIYNSLSSSANEIRQISTGYNSKTSGYELDSLENSTAVSFWSTTARSSSSSFSGKITIIYGGFLARSSF